MGIYFYESKKSTVKEKIKIKEPVRKRIKDKKKGEKNHDSTLIYKICKNM